MANKAKNSVKNQKKKPGEYKKEKFETEYQRERRMAKNHRRKTGNYEQ